MLTSLKLQRCWHLKEINKSITVFSVQHILMFILVTKAPELQLQQNCCAQRSKHFNAHMLICCRCKIGSNYNSDRRVWNWPLSYWWCRCCLKQPSLMSVMGMFYILSLLERNPWLISTGMIKQILIVRTRIKFITFHISFLSYCEYIVKWSQTLIV